MKNTFLIVALFLSTTAHAQRTHGFLPSMMVGTDFGAAYTTLGLEAGMYGISSKHSYLFIAEADRIGNKDLEKYGRGNKIFHPFPARSSHVVAVKYVYRFAMKGDVDFCAVVQPWYSLNMDIATLYVGARITEHIHGFRFNLEFLKDPFQGRNSLRIIFTPNLRPLF